MIINDRKMKFFSFLMGMIAVVQVHAATPLTLRDAFQSEFKIGVALNTDQITGQNGYANGLILKHFNSIVAENCMKSEHIQPREGQFGFNLPDQFVALGEKNNLHIVGHTLIWHSQTPPWFFVDANGKTVSREVLIERMRQHIHTIVTRYKGRVKGWDVVNEAINDDGSWRQSPFYQIIGKDFVKLAFRFAHEADPQAELYYNDYSMALEGRRNAVMAMVKELKNEGVQITGIGMQGHLNLDFPLISAFEKSIVAFASLGMKVMITELDMSILPSPWTTTGANVADKAAYNSLMNPYTDAIPRDVQEAWNQRYVDFFRIFVRHSDKICRVTLWGLTDGDSWKNDWPITGRTDFPLLFDRNYQPKEVVNRLLEL